MSLAGIAIAIGVLVDAAIVVTENAFRFIEQRGVDPRDRAARGRDRAARRRAWSGGPIFFSMAIIILAFVPVFALTGQEGKLFHPLAFTKTFAMLGATLLAVTLVPVLCTLLIGGRIHGEERQPRACGRSSGSTGPLLGWALRHRVLTLGAGRRWSFAGAVALRAADRQGVHAAAERGRPDVHAGHRSGDLAAAGASRSRRSRTRRSSSCPRSPRSSRRSRAPKPRPIPAPRQHERDHRAPEARGRSGGRG